MPLRVCLFAVALIACGKSENKPKITLSTDPGSGSGSAPEAPPPTAIDAAGAAPTTSSIATKIVAGGKTTCAIRPDTTVACWGHNEYGQAGDGTTTDASKPVTVNGLTGVKDLVLTATSACALKQDGTVACWGRLGDGKDKLLAPTALPGVAGATRFVGEGCVAVANDDVMCWRAFPFVKTPGTAVVVPELAKAVSFIDGFAVYADGTTKFVDDNKKLVESKLTNAAEYQTHGGDDVYCGRYDDGIVKCFGNSMKCKLGQADAIMTRLPGGDGETPFTTELVTLQLPPAKALALDLSENLCAVTKENQLMCVDVGDASYKGCGKVHSLLEGVAFVSGNCAVLGDGSVNCVTIDERRRMLVAALSGSTGVTQLAISYSHGCALAPAGLFCWGANDRGQLGQGTIDKAPPKKAGWRPVIDAVQVKL
jgi:hypothetical protein